MKVRSLEFLLNKPCISIPIFVLEYFHLVLINHLLLTKFNNYKIRLNETTHKIACLKFFQTGSLA